MSRTPALAKVMEGLSDKPIQSGYIALKNQANIIDAVNEHVNIVNVLKEINKEEVIKEIIGHTQCGKRRHMGVYE